MLLARFRSKTPHRNRSPNAMKRADLTEKLLDIKREKQWTWKHICERSAACRLS